jgi:methionyl-tRNA formyltransferase
MVAGSPLRIVFFGTPAFAVPTLRGLIESHHTVVAVVSQPDRPKGRGHHVSATPAKELALRQNVAVLQPVRLRDDAFLGQMSGLTPDLGVVAAYGRILPDALLQIPRLGLINVHASLLPHYRGAAPVHRAVINGDTETGVTIMRVVQELDAGPMLAAVTRPIPADATSVDVERDLADAGAPLLLDVVNRIAVGPVAGMPQDHSQATYAPKLSKTESPIDWTLPADRIYNLVRGLQPWPMASTSIEGARCLVHRAAVSGDSTESAPGTVVIAESDVIAVATGGGFTLQLVQIQPEGRRVMTAREFLSGRHIARGTLLRST